MRIKNNWFKKLLGQLGIGNYCTCGVKKKFLYKHGYDNDEVWICPKCDEKTLPKA